MSPTPTLPDHDRRRHRGQLDRAACPAPAVRGSIYTYPAQGLHPVVGYLVGWGYAMITGLVGPIVNLLIGYFVGTILNTELGWAGDRSAI